ncbi:unnamed protein product [Ectocarpus sp. CCAP 1310/34]|nr:unnamed protein product [Ectocarpus sp. CCAP 1310/34]
MVTKRKGSYVATGVTAKGKARTENANLAIMLRAKEVALAVREATVAARGAAMANEQQQQLFDNSGAPYTGGLCIHAQSVDSHNKNIMPTSEDSEIDLSTLSKEELQQEVQRRVDAQLAKERAEIAPLPAEQQSPTIGEQSLRPTPADIPPTGNQLSPSSLGSQSFNNPTNVASIVAQAVKATAGAMSGHQGFAHAGTFRVNPGSEIDPCLGSVKKEQDLYIMFEVFRSKMVSYFQEEGVYDVLGITDVKVGKRGVDLAELRGIFGTDVVDKSLKLWNIIISKILYPPIQNLIMACESPQQGWKIVTNFYQEKKESEKTRLEQEWLALEMRESENPQDYIARSEALRLRLASVGTIKDTTHAYKDVVRGLPPSYAVQEGILQASDVVTLHALETVVRDAHMEMERERSKEQRREAELALVASGASRSGGGNGGASGGQGVVDGQDREIRDGERNRDVICGGRAREQPPRIVTGVAAEAVAAAGASEEEDRRREPAGVAGVG